MREIGWNLGKLGKPKGDTKKSWSPSTPEDDRKGWCTFFRAVLRTIEREVGAWNLGDPEGEEREKKA
jgi:hypothetical protein